MSDKKDNVIQFPTKANVPDTLTVSFGDSIPVTYALSSNNIDLSGIDTVTVDIPDNYDWENTIAVTDPVEMLEAEMVRQMELDLKDE